MAILGHLCGDREHKQVHVDIRYRRGASLIDPQSWHVKSWSNQAECKNPRRVTKPSQSLSTHAQMGPACRRGRSQVLRALHIVSSRACHMKHQDS